MSLAERVANYTVDSNGCWVHNNKPSNRGYVNLFHKEGTRTAHRSSYEVNVGHIPDGMLVLHKCDVRNCVNPDHLFLGTNVDNMRDMVSKGRSSKRYGEDNPNNILTNEEREDIRGLYILGMTKKKIADLYEIGLHLVCQTISKG